MGKIAQDFSSADVKRYFLEIFSWDIKIFGDMERWLEGKTTSLPLVLIIDIDKAKASKNDNDILDFPLFPNSNRHDIIFIRGSSPELGGVSWFTMFYVVFGEGQQLTRPAAPGEPHHLLALQGAAGLASCIRLARYFLSYRVLLASPIAACMVSPGPALVRYIAMPVYVICQ